jgi:hypothetical protein
MDFILSKCCVNLRIADEDARLKRNLDWNSIIRVSIVHIWWMCTYCVCYFLKHLLNDSTCSKHPNRYLHRIVFKSLTIMNDKVYLGTMHTMYSMY